MLDLSQYLALPEFPHVRIYADHTDTSTTQQGTAPPVIALGEGHKEIETDQNTALGIVIGSFIIGLAIIVAAAISG